MLWVIRVKQQIFVSQLSSLLAIVSVAGRILTDFITGLSHFIFPLAYS